MEKIDVQIARLRSGLTIIKKIAECCQKEAESWQSNIQALQKARQEELQAVQKAKEKEMKEKQKALAREADKASKAAKKEQDRLDKEVEKSRKDDETKNGGDSAAQRGKRRRTGGVFELTESDPAILREMSKFSTGSLPLLDDFNDFLETVGKSPLLASGCRLKRSCLKRALQVL